MSVGQVGGRPDGRFVLLPQPVAMPGECKTCRKTQDVIGFVDTGLQVDFEGAFVYCSECVAAFATLIGYISPETYEDLETRNSVLVLENNDLLAKIHKLGVVENAVNNYMFSFGATVPVDTSSVQSTEPERTEVSIDDSVTTAERILSTDDSVTAGADNDSPKLTLVERPDDVPDASSIFDELGI